MMLSAQLRLPVSLPAVTGSDVRDNQLLRDALLADLASVLRVGALSLSIDARSVSEGDGRASCVVVVTFPAVGVGPASNASTIAAAVAVAHADAFATLTLANAELGTPADVNAALAQTRATVSFLVGMPTASLSASVPLSSAAIVDITALPPSSSATPSPSKPASGGTGGVGGLDAGALAGIGIGGAVVLLVVAVLGGFPLYRLIRKGRRHRQVLRKRGGRKGAAPATATSNPLAAAPAPGSSARSLSGDGNNVAVAVELAPTRTGGERRGDDTESLVGGGGPGRGSPPAGRPLSIRSTGSAPAGSVEALVGSRDAFRSSALRTASKGVSDGGGGSGSDRDRDRPHSKRLRPQQTGPGAE